jgi:hypothetical protein
MFSQDKGGVILNPQVAARCLICSYAADGGTWGKPDGCGTQWCDPVEGSRDPWCGGRPFAPEQLKLMLQGHATRDQYNEVVVDTRCLNQNLPKSIEAIFYPSSCVVGSECMQDAVRAHRDFVFESHYSVQEYPLVIINLRNWARPFSAS